MAKGRLGRAGRDLRATKRPSPVPGTLAAAAQLPRNLRGTDII